MFDKDADDCDVQVAGDGTHLCDIGLAKAAWKCATKVGWGGGGDLFGWEGIWGRTCSDGLLISAATYAIAQFVVVNDKYCTGQLAEQGVPHQCEHAPCDNDSGYGC